MYVHIPFRRQTNVHMEGRINIRSMAVQNRNIRGMARGLS
jgi:hypothetical protein